MLIAVDIEGERWFVDERALRSTLDGRERQRLVLRHELLVRVVRRVS